MVNWIPAQQQRRPFSWSRRIAQTGVSNLVSRALAVHFSLQCFQNSYADQLFILHNLTGDGNVGQDRRVGVALWYPNTEKQLLQHTLYPLSPLLKCFSWIFQGMFFPQRDHILLWSKLFSPIVLWLIAKAPARSCRYGSLLSEWIQPDKFQHFHYVGWRRV